VGGGLPLDQLMAVAGPAMTSMMQPGVAPTATGMFTPEMMQAALDDLDRFGGGLESLYGTASYGPGGAQVTQAQKIPGRDLKKEAFKKYLINKGVDPSTAERKANNLRFRDSKGFRKAIKRGEFEGLSVDDGRIRAEQQFTPGGVQMGGESERLLDALRSLGMTGIGGMQGMLSQGFNQQGLLPSQQKSLDEMKARYMDEFSDVYRDSTRSALGELVGSGTSKSSFAPGFIADTAGKAQSRFLTQAMGELAGREEQMLTGRAGRQAQALRNYQSGIMSPGAAGLFTDPQSAQMAATLQQQNIANRFQQQGLRTALLSSPVDVMPGAGPGGDEGGLNLGGAATGALAGFATGGPVGAIIGGVGGLLG